MRTLFLLRGAPGTGKSTWVRENHLEQYTLSADGIRLLHAGPILDQEGNFVISQKHDSSVWKLLMKLLEDRMARGEFVIVDATHYKSTLLGSYKKLISKYRYRSYVVDFTSVPIEETLRRNRERDAYKFVPEDVIKKMYALMENDTEVSTRYTIISPEDAVKKLHESLLFDYNDKYKKVVMIGDIHGCYEPIKKYFEENPIDDETSYIFLGDYIDRGIQNKEVLEFLLSIYERKNVLLLEGNHERWLRLYSNDKDSIVPIDKEFIKAIRIIPNYKDILYDMNRDKVRSPEFVDNTVEQIKEIPDKELRKLCTRFAQMAYFKFGNKEYFVCHGGIATLPNIFVSTEELIKGVGKYEDTTALYDAWTKKYDNNIVLVHGHRNMLKHIPHPKDNIYNLCSEIEFGAPLRILELIKNEDGSVSEIVKEYENPVFSTEVKHKSKTLKELEMKTEVDALSQMNNSKYIIKKMLSDDIVSYNFSRDCFFKREWNELTCHARGLFVDFNTSKVVCRSYNKFFNWGEMDETKSPALSDNLVFPVMAYRKENGFLALISYNAKKDELLICSKTTNEGPMVDIIKKQVNEFSKEKLDKIKDYVKNNNCTLVCECIDIVEDPHIIKYDKNHLILLDIVKNDLEFGKLPYDEMVNVAIELGLEYKLIEYTFNTFEELYTFKHKQDVSYDIRHEGWVFEDANGFMVKYKTRFYKFWKMMRAIKEKFDKGRPPKKVFSSEDEIRVFKLLESLNNEGKLATMNIIDVEDAYYNKE